MDTTTIVSSKGQVVIPKVIRNALGLHSGSQLLIHVRADHTLELSPLQKNITSFFGQGLLNNTEFINVDEAIGQAVSDNVNL